MGNRVFAQWVRATWAGWLLGIPIIAVLALLGEAAGIGGSQFIVGAGMGAGIGLMQGRRIRGLLHRFGPWFWSCTVGLALPFLAVDIGMATGWVTTFSLYACVAAGGLIIGVWQTMLLRSSGRKAGLWLVGSLAGWMLASGTVATSDWLFRSRAVPGILGGVAYLASLAAGGLMLGLVTGIALVRIVDSPLDSRGHPA